jgi:Cd2+/Zn2+-exporting ATPase
MVIAEYLQDIIKGRTQQALKSLLSLIPRNVIIKKDDQEITMPVEAVIPGMLVIVKTGRRIPVDGIITEGRAAINESALTGESALKEKNKDDVVYAGSFIAAGSIVIKTEKIAQDTLFARIVSLVEQSQKSKATIATFADKVSFFLVPSMLVGIGLVWIIKRDASLVVTLLVFGSPLELSLVTPLAVLAGIAAAFRHGILVKGGIALEQFSQVDTIVFDKTGTLTIGEPEIIAVEVLDSKYTERDIVKIAAIAEKNSDHVLAKAILSYAFKLGIDVPNPTTYTSFVGHGVEITYQSKHYFLGNKHFIEAPEHANIPIKTSGSEEGFYSSFYLACAPDSVCGKILIADKIRSDARNTIDSLKKDGIKSIILLSGDRQAIVGKIAKQLGIDQYYGEFFPDQKIAMIKDLQQKKHKVAMVGDGINDAPALQQANVGIALGAMGMEPAIEAADIVLMTNDLYKIVYIHQLSQKTLKIIKQNIIIGFGLIHSIGIALAFLKLITPIQAALFHSVPDLAMLINSARLIQFKGNKLK